MGNRFTVVIVAIAALASAAACGGKSVMKQDGEGGAGGEPEHAGTGGAKGGTPGHGGSDSSSSGGTAPRGGTDSPPANSGGTDSPPANSGGTDSPAANGGGTGATSGTGTGGTSECPTSTEVLLLPDANGWIDATAPCNRLGVHGGWYVFADQYGSASCLTLGHHMASECAVVTTPDPFSGVFPNVDGAMHTAGVVEQILPCVEWAALMTSGCPANDYANMWGAGIGFDLNAEGGNGDTLRKAWDATRYGVLGLSFTIDAVPLPGLRVEFPMLLTDAEAAQASPALPPGSTTDGHPAGAPYWGAQSRGDGKFPTSPVLPGDNTIYWADIASPVLSAYVFDPRRLISVRFHVPTSSASAAAYDFTISNVRLITQARL